MNRKRPRRGPRLVGVRSPDRRHRAGGERRHEPGSASASRRPHLAGRIFSQPLDRGRPLWEMWIVDGLADGRFAVVNKMHHALQMGLVRRFEEARGAHAAADAHGDDAPALLLAAQLEQECADHA